MASPPTDEVSRLLSDWRSGDQAALDRLIPIVYDELHRIAHRHLRDERAARTLQTTGLLDEAYLQLIGANVAWEGRTHFLAIAARTMRQRSQRS
ncbi:MAG: ECF-type sigma factor [Gemmatimonadetes bacterium]|nr:ECF-type sigma factor [Gemmatimonadota bacterium]